ncbi:MAG: L-lactate permease [Candidatus Aminicenantia bacterium]
MHLSIPSGAIIGFLPILLVLILMIRFSLPAFKAMPLGWFISFILAIFIWRSPINWVIGATLKGFLISIDILLIVFGAVLLYFTMVEGGAINVISKTVIGMSEDRRIQANLAWLLGAFFEGVAGFGTPGAIVGPLLFGIGFPAILSASLVLIFNSTPVSFGCVGIPVWGGVGGTLKSAEIQNIFSSSGIDYNYWVNSLLTRHVAIIHGIIGSFLPLLVLFLLIKWNGGSKEDFRSGIIPALLAGFSFTIPYTFFAFLLGPEFPSLLGSILGILFYNLLIKAKIVRTDKVFKFPLEKGTKSEEIKGIPRFKAFLPYILIAIFLLLTRSVKEIKSFVETTFMLTWNEILGTGISQSIKILNNPGIYFIFIVLISHFLFKMEREKIKGVWLKTFKRLTLPAIALSFALALSQIMIYTSENPFKMEPMIMMIAKGISALTGKLFSIFSPFVGILGAYIAGSNTVSNIMFAGFQFASANLLGLSKTVITSLQVVGGAVGNMICVHNVVAVCATVGIIGREGEIIKKNLIPCLIYGILAGIIGTAFIIIFPNLF